MLKQIKAHECLCEKCEPDYVDHVFDQARITAQEDYEKSIASKVKVDLYDAAVAKYKEEAESIAMKDVRRELKEEL